MASTVRASETTVAARTACTLDPANREARLREWQSLRSNAMISESHSEAGSVSVFRADADVDRRIDALIHAENDCCSHLRYKVTRDDEQIAIEITSSAEAH